MPLDYKLELEKASKNLIMVHKPDVLMKMIARTIVQKMQISHAGILLHDDVNKFFILTVSKGPSGTKIPAGFTRMDYDNSLIHFFREAEERKVFKSSILLYGEAKDIADRLTDAPVKKLLTDCLYQMDILEAEVAIPSYFRETLMGILLLGRKKDGNDFGKEELDFLGALSDDVAMAISNAKTISELNSANNRLADELKKKQQLFLNTTIALAQAIDAKDHYTHSHTSRVTQISMAIAKQMAPIHREVLTAEFNENLHIASLLHDIGKIGIPESILNKQGPLTNEEFAVIKTHPVIGSNILKPIQELKAAIDGVKYHHERYDGRGYPEGKKGDEIPLIAAIISVADAFDAMNSDRPYRKGLSIEQALVEIEKNRGSQFNPEVADVFLNLMKEGKLSFNA